MKKMGLFRSGVALFAALGLTLPAGFATAETLNNEVSSNQVSTQMAETVYSTDSTVESSPEVDEAPKSEALVANQLSGTTETNLDSYREGDKNMTGRTTPNATVTITPTEARAVAQGTADENGNINIAVDQLNLKEGQVATVSIEDENNGKAEFPVTVLAMETASTTTDTTSSVADVTSTTTDTTSSTTDTTSTTTDSTSGTTEPTSTTTDPTSGTTEPTTTSSTDPVAEETKLINEKTMISKVYDDDVFLYGVTIPNATVEIAVAENTTNEESEAASAAIIARPQKSDAKGHFLIEFQNLKLQVGQELIITVTGPNGGTSSFGTTVLPAADRDPAAYAENKRIKKETKLDSVYEGDTRLTGKTIPNAELAMSIGDGTRWVEGWSDENGNIHLVITELNLKADQEVIVTIYGPDGGQIDFPMIVKRHEIVSTNTGGLTGGESTNQYRINQVWQRVLPATGEGQQPIFVLLGVVALGASGLLYFRRR